MKFVLNGCDISFVAEAPEDIKLRDLIIQCDRIEPDWCACGICSLEARELYNAETEIFITEGDVWKANDGVCCKIRPKKTEEKSAEKPDTDYKTAYFIDEDMNIYTTPLHNRTEAMEFAEKHDYCFIGFLSGPEFLV